MTKARKTRLGTLPPLLAAAFVAFAGGKLLSGRRRIGPPMPDPFGVSTGRGVPGTPPSSAAIAEGYEVADASGRSLAIVMGVFAAAASLAIGGTVLALHLFGGTPAADSQYTRLQAHPIEPPEPHLQADPLTDLARYQASQAAAASGYAALGHGLARIPIARAMALVQGKSLDPAPQAAP